MIKQLLFFHLLLIGLLLFPEAGYSQIRGVVVNQETSSTLPGVNIVVLPNSLKGTSTDSNGNFILNNIEYPVEIQFSVLGFETKTVRFNEPDSSVLVALKPSVMGLEEIVVVPDRIINPLTNSSSIARSSVSIEQLDDKSVSTAVELLRAETGVFVQQTSVGQGSIYIRGRAGRDVLYLFNGFRMNPSFIRSGQNQYFGAVDPFLISRLDVYRGPVSVYYGSDALSGGVNISPIVKDFTDSPDVTGEVASFLNINGNGEKSVHGKLAYESKRFTIFAGGTFRDYDYYNMSSRSNEALWFPYDETLDNADYQFKSFQLSSKIRTSGSSDLTLISYYGEIPDAPRLDRITLGYEIENKAGMGEDETLTPQEGYYSNTSPLTFWGNTAEYRVNTAKPAFESIGFKVGYFRLRDFRKDQDFAFNQSPEYTIHEVGESDYDFEISDTTSYDQSSSNQLQASVDVQTYLSDKLYLKWGGDVSYDQVSSERFTSFGTRSLSRYPDGSEYILSGAFAQIDYAATNAFSMEFGLRYSHIFANIPFEGVNTERKYDPYSSDFGQFTSALGLTYKVNETLSILSNISSGFRAPNISDLSEIGTRRSTQFQTPNTTLVPEKTTNLDLGLHYNDGQFEGEFFAFWLHYFDKITRVETGNTVNEFGQIIPPDSIGEYGTLYNEVTNQNANSMDLLGVEFNGRYKVTDHVSSGLTFTYTWGNLVLDDGTTEPADRVPPANGIFYVDYRPTKLVSVRPQARYAFAHRRISPNEIDDVRISSNGTDGFVNLQFLLNIKPMDNLSLKFLADNIMDIAYREHASSLDGMGRNYTISINYTF